MVYSQRRVISISVHCYICKIVKKNYENDENYKHSARLETAQFSVIHMQKRVTSLEEISRRTDFFFSNRDVFQFISLISEKLVLKISA